MKKIIFFTATAVLALTAFRSDNTCESYFPSKKGVKYELTTYDDKNNPVSRSQSEVTDITSIPDGIEAKVHTTMYDKKDKEQASGDIVFRCAGNKFYMDLSQMMKQNMPANMSNMEIEMTNQYMEFPADLSPGDKLPDASTTMNIKMNGMTVNSTNMNVTDRKIDAIESITTPAGTFDCLKYSYTTNISSPMYKSSSKGTSWLCKNVGMVRSESYEDNGKIKSSTVMTAFSK